MGNRHVWNFRKTEPGSVFFIKPALRMSSLVQYFTCLDNPFFLHFLSVLIICLEVVSEQAEMEINRSTML
ncbi:hypothetical protein T11_6844 [Trichinella zimbabwensis]|uniref:Uncharacterized protein n=1 Tax=Trichinella zimbabwensis TaxID=268475 RepID=A0A0V1GRY8_9BILA|nr:hypothetical protein T11_6844 [Trichinella zimbabwensis]